jgi:hypothetical protein
LWNLRVETFEALRETSKVCTIRELTAIVNQLQGVANYFSWRQNPSTLGSAPRIFGSGMNGVPAR